MDNRGTSVTLTLLLMARNVLGLQFATVRSTPPTAPIVGSLDMFKLPVVNIAARGVGLDVGRVGGKKKMSPQLSTLIS